MLRMALFLLILAFCSSCSKRTIPPVKYKFELAPGKTTDVYRRTKPKPPLPKIVFLVFSLFLGAVKYYSEP